MKRNPEDQEVRLSVSPYFPSFPDLSTLSFLLSLPRPVHPSHQDLTFAHFQALYAVRASHPLGAAFEALSSWDEPYARMTEPSPQTLTNAATSLKSLSSRVFEHAANYYRSLFQAYQSHPRFLERLRVHMATATNRFVWSQVYLTFFQLVNQCVRSPLPPLSFVF